MFPILSLLSNDFPFNPSPGSPADPAPSRLYELYHSNAFVMFAFLLKVSGASHEVLFQRVPPLAPAGPVTHGGREGELIPP